jgi:type IV pilus assembly protein PilN
MQAVETLIHINLLPTVEERSSRRLLIPSRTAVVMLFALGTVFGLMALTSVVQGLRVRALRAEVEATQTQARQLQPLIQRIDQLTQEREAVRRRLDIIENLDQNRFTRVRLADELSRRLPDQVWLTSFSESQGSIVITGVTFSNLSVAELISRLERSVLYEGVDLVVSRRGTIEEHEVVNFTITARHQHQAAATSPNPAG